MARVRPVPMSRYINGFVTKIFAEELINQSLNNLNYSNEFTVVILLKSLFKNDQSNIIQSLHNRFTFKVKKHKVDDVYFVSVLTNPDVYQFLGIIKNQKFTHSKSSKISKDAQSFRVFDYVFFNLCKGTLPEFIEIWHEGKCGKCGRTLTVPLSIETGFGPECQKRSNR
jgi:hypothetical protein